VEATPDEGWIKEAAAAFQESIIDVLVAKTIGAAQRLKARQILLAGGVASNQALRERMLASSPLPVLIPPPILCTDNAAMIASCAYFHLISGQTESSGLDVVPGLSFAG
jgi:N6-L-threonylcarbamoyladenine synthase